LAGFFRRGHFKIVIPDIRPFLFDFECFKTWLSVVHKGSYPYEKHKHNG